jgi:hypothetical protein
MPVPEFIVQTCRIGHYELGPQREGPAWEARQGAITGLPGLSWSPYSESLRRSDTPDAASHRVWHQGSQNRATLHQLPQVPGSHGFLPIFLPMKTAQWS